MIESYLGFFSSWSDSSVLSKNTLWHIYWQANVNCFFSKPKLSRKEARWLKTLCNFGIFPITLKPGKIRVVVDALSRAPHIAFNALELPFIQIYSVIGSYEMISSSVQLYKPWMVNKFRIQLRRIKPRIWCHCSKGMERGYCMSENYASIDLQSQMFFKCLRC